MKVRWEPSFSLDRRIGQTLGLPLAPPALFRNHNPPPPVAGP